MQMVEAISALLSVRISLSSGNQGCMIMFMYFPNQKMEKEKRVSDFNVGELIIENGKLKQKLQEANEKIEKQEDFIREFIWGENNTNDYETLHRKLQKANEKIKDYEKVLKGLIEDIETPSRLGLEKPVNPRWAYLNRAKRLLEKHTNQSEGE